MRRAVELVGPILCVVAGGCMVAALAVDLDSRPARILIAIAGSLFVPGAFVTLAAVRLRAGRPR